MRIRALLLALVLLAAPVSAAWDFDDASDEYCTAVTLPSISAWPMSMSCWFVVDDQAADHGFISLAGTGTSEMIGGLYYDEDSADDGVTFLLYASGGFSKVKALEGGTGSTEISLTNGTWYGVVGIGYGQNSQAVFFKGDYAGPHVKTTATFDQAWTTPTDLALGKMARDVNAWFAPHDGRLADCAIWDVALDDDEAWAITDGFSAQMIRPSNLVWYQDLRNDTQNKIDNSDCTDNGTPTDFDDHAQVVYPQ